MRILARAAVAACVVVLTVPARASAQDAQCHSLKFRSNFRLNGASQYLDLADHAASADLKRGPANNALRVLREAAAAGGADQFTLWFLFGRTYTVLGDLPGADSSFTRATALAAGDAACVTEITRLRRNLWVPLQNEAVNLMQAQNFDSALVLLRRSNLIYRDDPAGYMNMASAFLSQEKMDSAIVAFRLASRAGTSADRAGMRSRASQLVAQMLQRSGQLAEAEVAWREYLALKPRDMAARGSLAIVLTGLHRSQDAAAVYDSILAQADSLDALSLFDTGVSLFRQAQADSANKMGWFRRAARAFELGCAKSPYDRDGVFNLTNAYLALADTARTLQAAQRLVTLDSMNRRSLTLLAQAQVTSGQRAEAVRTLLRRDSLAFEVNVLGFEPRDSTASLRGGVQNLQARELPEFQLRFEFLNARGEVVATERIPVGPLGAAGGLGSAYDFNLQATGRGIIAYRYKVGG